MMWSLLCIIIFTSNKQQEYQSQHYCNQHCFVIVHICTWSGNSIPEIFPPTIQIILELYQYSNNAHFSIG